MTIQLCRNALHPWLDNHFFELRNKEPHPGLLLARGLTLGGDGTEGTKANHIAEVAKLKPTTLYEAAYKRWAATVADQRRFKSFEAPLQGRLYIGVTRDSALETGITTSHAYGMPLIPGSAAKGMARAAAEDWKVGDDALAWMFGRDAEKEDEGAAGGLIFHDAWWVPEGVPFASETVTVHHPEYYKEGAAEATDFDSPVPAPQIAARGRFLFAIEGDPAWAVVAARILRTALSEKGIGAKRGSGYGFFASAETATSGKAGVGKQDHWHGARLKFNAGNGTLSAEKPGAIAYAYGEAGRAMQESLSAQLKGKICGGFCKADVVVSGQILLSVEG